MKNMKHLKTFESFSTNTEVELVDEGWKDIVKKTKDMFSMKPPVNERKKRIITKTVNTLDAGKVTCMALGKDGDKVDFNKEGFLKLAEETDNFNGSSLVKGDCIHYIPASYSSASGSLKGTGGLGG